MSSSNGSPVVDGAWSLLDTRGFVVVRGFLSTGELENLVDAFKRSRRADVASYVAMEATASDAAPVVARIRALLPSIRAASLNRADTVVGQGVFFATDRMDLSWHSDSKSFYLFQGHRHHLSFWIPIIKESSDKSGLSVVPMDRLRDRAESIFRLVEGQGSVFYEGGYLRYEDGYRDRRIACPVDIDALAEAPSLVPGDALVMRSDVLHRTQDTTTYRVSLGMRALVGGHPLARSELLRASPTKRARILGEPNAFCEALAAFWLHRRSQITVAEFLDSRPRFERKELVPRLAFAGARVVLPPLLVLSGLVRGAPR
jgi:ectoine hydroxylase-related dioxygenase (phytanoyl-CoA dioxygenase family)